MDGSFAMASAGVLDCRITGRGSRGWLMRGPFHLPDAAATSLRRKSNRMAAPVGTDVQGTTAKRFNTTLRAIAVGAGAGIGFLRQCGSATRLRRPLKRGPYDDNSGLEGIMIGADRCRPRGTRPGR